MTHNSPKHPVNNNNNNKTIKRKGIEKYSKNNKVKQYQSSLSQAFINKLNLLSLFKSVANAAGSFVGVVKCDDRFDSRQSDFCRSSRQKQLKVLQTHKHTIMHTLFMHAHIYSPRMWSESLLPKQPSPQLLGQTTGH